MTTIALATYRTVAKRHAISRYGLARRLADPAWLARHGITAQAPGRYDRAMAARIAAAYKADSTTERARTLPSTFGLDRGWRCLHCGGTTRERRCLSCELSIGRAYDLRPVRLRRRVDISHLVGDYAGGGEYDALDDRVDALRREPLDEQFDFLLRLLRANLDRGNLVVREGHLRRLLLRLGWDEGSPWEAVVLLLRRTCPRCGTAVVGLESILRRGGRVKLTELGHDKLCSGLCERTGPLPDGWRERLAEVRSRKQAAGEMA